jgi:hypothetical protein
MTNSETQQKEVVVLDIETECDFATAKSVSKAQGVQNVQFAAMDWIAVTRTESGDVKRWLRLEAAALLEYLSMRLVTGWNIHSFDLPIIAITALAQNHHGVPLESIDPFEKILKETSVMYKLEDVCRLNFGVGKLGDSANIPKLFLAQDYEPIFAHCERDTELEMMVYRVARFEGLKLPAIPPSKYLPNGREESLWTME